MTHLISAHAQLDRLTVRDRVDSVLADALNLTSGRARSNTQDGRKQLQAQGSAAIGHSHLRPARRGQRYVSHRSTSPIDAPARPRAQSTRKNALDDFRGRSMETNLIAPASRSYAQRRTRRRDDDDDDLDP